MIIDEKADALTQLAVESLNVAILDASRSCPGDEAENLRKIFIQDGTRQQVMPSSAPSSESRPRYPLERAKSGRLQSEGPQCVNL